MLSRNRIEYFYKHCKEHCILQITKFDSYVFTGKLNIVSFLIKIIVQYKDRTKNHARPGQITTRDYTG